MAIRENVLLTCLSKVDFRKGRTDYAYFYSNDHGDTIINELKERIKEKDSKEINKMVETKISEEVQNKQAMVTDGILTNEAPAKIVLSLVNKIGLDELDVPKKSDAEKKEVRNHWGKLDRVVVLCSDDVNKPLSENTEFNGNSYTATYQKAVINSNYSENSGSEENNKEKIFDDLLKNTHYTYFENEVKKYAKDLQNENKNINVYKDLIPEFLPVSISNNPGEYDIAEAAIEAADNILGPEDNKKTEKKIHLYIDYNGGPRYIASMLLNTANLMEQRGVTIENILTMNYENKIGKYVQVESFMGVLQSSRLVSGIKEFVDYGRCKELKQYFDPKICGDKDIQDILKQMEGFSEYLETCDTEKIFGNENSDEENVIKGLRSSLENYTADNPPQEDATNADKSQNSSTPFRILFEYVAKDILREYERVFTGDLLEIIDWCCDKGFIQQALTFCYERIPIYLWDTGVYRPTAGEEKEYNQIKEVCKALKSVDFSQRNRSGRANQFSEAFAECSLPDDPANPVPVNNDDPNDPANHLKGAIEQNIINAFDRNMDAIKNLRNNFLNYDWKFSWSQKYIPSSRQSTYEWMYASLRQTQVSYIGSELRDLSDNEKPCFVNRMLCRNGSFRAESNKFTYDDNSNDGREKKKQFFDIMYKYQRIRKQRNIINHAEASADDSVQVNTRWSYNELKDNLKDYVKQISDFMK